MEFDLSICNKQWNIFKYIRQKFLNNNNQYGWQAPARISHHDFLNSQFPNEQ